MAAVADLNVRPLLHNSSFYREAVEGAVNYNSQLIKDRSKRLPYVDVQTGIAQITSPLLRSRLERQRGVAPGQLFSYPPRRWRREAKPLPILKKDPFLETSSRQASPATSGLIQTVEGKRSSRLATMTRSKDSTDSFLPSVVVGPVSVRAALESPGSSELNEEEDSPEPDADYMDEYDSEEERKQKKKKRPPPKIRSSVGNNVNVSLSRSTKGTDDKPFPCSSCNRRYKTAASLKAHRTQYHGAEMLKASPTASVPSVPVITHTAPPRKTEVRVPVILPPPPNLNGKEDAKPSPYCDFCLGDSTCNRKSSKAEKMVSCANCGRSAHPSCMQFSDALSAMVHTYRWQCIECKSCHFCGTSENDDQLLFCDDCDRGYHMYCLHPPLKNPPEGNWTCGMCFKLAV